MDRWQGEHQETSEARQAGKAALVASADNVFMSTSICLAVLLCFYVEKILLHVHSYFIE